MPSNHPCEPFAAGSSLRSLSALAIALAVLAGVVFRAASLQEPGGRAMAFRTEVRLGAAARQTLCGDRDGVLRDPLAAVQSSELAQIPATQLHDASLEWFDPEAEIVLTAGADGAPGRRGIDDDFDGVIDNPSELGAIGSDDHCATPTDPDFDQHINRPFSRVVDHGAYAPHPAELEAPAAVRVLVHGETRRRQWVWQLGGESSQ